MPLVPRKQIPERVRTDGKDKAFEQLEELRADGLLEGMKIPELSEETGWSEQHIRTVLQTYYTEAEETEQEVTPPAHENSISITVPGDVEIESYLRGWMAGYLEDWQD